MPTYTVLHVEDEPTDRMIVAAAFKKAAPNVLLKAVADGEQAIAYLAGQGAYGNRELNPMPLLVLLDIKLPRKSGLEVLEWIRKQPDLKSLPVIMLTSSSESNDLDQAYALGANSYLVKTVDLPTMREIARGIGEYAALVSAPPLTARFPAPG
jgi:CheY-like chemotaxis protein